MKRIEGREGTEGHEGHESRRTTAGLKPRHYTRASTARRKRCYYSRRCTFLHMAIVILVAACSGGASPALPALSERQRVEGSERSESKGAPPSTQPATITISVAASLTDVVTDLAKRYEAAGGSRVAVNAAASNTLARQIVDGAPVDLFISADEAQMDVVERAGRLVAGSRKPLLSNQLVIVVPRDAAVSVAGPHDLAKAAVERVAMGQPDAVPAGVYGRQWLEKQGLWRAVQPKVVPLPTVRAALAAVREGRVDAAIVYATDARSAPEVRVAYTHTGADPRIVYPAAVVKGSRERDASRFLEYLRSREALAVFEAAGFRVAVNFL